MKKKVYIVLHSLAVGGAERHASSIANYLSENDYEVMIILLDNDTVVVQLNEGVKVIALPNLEYPDNIKKAHPNLRESILLKVYKPISKKKYIYLDRFLYYKYHYITKLSWFFEQQEDIDNSIVISFMPIPNICCSAIQKKFNYKLILGEFSSPQSELTANAPENKMKKRCFQNAAGFVFQTEEQKEFYSYLTDVEKQIIPNPLEEIVVQPFIGERKKIIVNFCRLSTPKNIPLLIAAFAKIAEDYPEYSLVIYGEGPKRSEIEDCIIDYGLTERVSLMPFAENVLELVYDSAMFVSSSDWEGISNSMLEAMAIGLPVVCTDCPAGGARMFIKPYENGILVPVRDQQALAEAMIYMIEHPEDAEKMGRNAVEIRNTLEKEMTFFARSVAMVDIFF